MVDLSLVSIVQPCKSMRRSSSHHSAGGFYLFHKAGDDTVSYSPGGCVLPDLSCRGCFLTKASSANFFGLVSCCELSNSLFCCCAFSRWCSSMDNASFCNSSSVIVCTCHAMHRSALRYRFDDSCCCDFGRCFFLPLRNVASGGVSLLFSDGVNFSFLISMMARIRRWRCSALMCGMTGENLDLLILDSGNTLCRDASYHGVGYSLRMRSFPGGYRNVFRTNLRLNTSDHMIKKTGYIRQISYKAGIEIGLRQLSWVILFCIGTHAHLYNGGLYGAIFG